MTHEGCLLCISNHLWTQLSSHTTSLAHQYHDILFPHHFWNQLNHQSPMIQEKLKWCCRPSCFLNSPPTMKLVSEGLCVEPLHIEIKHFSDLHTVSLYTNCKKCNIHKCCFGIYKKSKSKLQRKNALIEKIHAQLHSDIHI